jgi:NgoFVII restriction endonuclease.
MNENISLFDNLSDEPGTYKKSNTIDVVKLQYLGAETIGWKDLFSGFNKLYAITYSSGIGFICELLKNFDYAEIIFGCDEVMTYSIQEVMAYQDKTLEKLRDTSSKFKVDLNSKIDDGTLKMFVAREKLSHEKIYILEAEDGRKRVVMGSANMSYTAFSGMQRENICYLDGDEAYEWYINCFSELKESSTDNISVSALSVADCADNITELPVMQTIKVRKALVIETNNNLKEDVKFILDVKKLSTALTPFVPKADKKGKIILSPEKVIHTRRLISDAAAQEKEIRSEYPQLVVDVYGNNVTLNDMILDLNPSDEEIKNDISLFLEYMDGYNRFHGDVSGMQNKYYTFANWFFSSPFMAIMRNMAFKCSQNILPYPVFGLVYGQSKAGKTSFLMTLLQMMIGQKPRISAPDFTRSNIDNLKRTVNGAPIIVDDLTNNRFVQHAIETIKNEDFGISDGLIYYPAVVISANEDVKAVSQEITRRTIICHVEAGLTNTETMQSGIVKKVQKNIGTAFYRKYLSIMLDKVPELIEDMKNEDNICAPDILSVSSQVLYELINTYYENSIPEYVRCLSLDDYFSEKVTGSQVIKTIQRAWQINKKAFEIDRRLGQLRYNAGQSYEADRILKELPEDLEPHKSRECIVMDLNRSCDFFGINFKKRNGIMGLFDTK